MAREKVAEMLNRMVPEFRGQDANTVRAAITTRLAQIGATPTSAELDIYIQGITDGKTFHA
ncbi:hypothetical protein [Streptomyces sp. NPDC018059]|uniref:hypothetical protein n=1 Tax=Streptomyces sp. NPDC018059 TaxID=3365041 RepID=UPI0037ABDE1F